MKKGLSFVLIFSMGILLLAPGSAKADYTYSKPQLNLTQQPPVVYTYGAGYSAFGIKVMFGLSMASIRYSLELDPAQEDALNELKKSLMGIVGGIGFDSGGRFAVEINILYMQKGGKYDGRIEEGADWVDISADLFINELVVPVLLKIRFLEGTSPYILAGGEFGYILSSKLKYRIEDSYGGLDSGSEDLFAEDEDDSLNRFDYGAVFGGGVELLLGGITVFLEGRFHMGFANLVKSEDLPETNNWIRTAALVFFGGLKF